MATLEHHMEKVTSPTIGASVGLKMELKCIHFLLFFSETVPESGQEAEELSS